ncbi:MAG: hypothetical protein HZA66_26815 [Rhodopseudomonas palustris]|uniref:Uncharacterized protein n=1 Tax=Rhodopseudomonas palustris TaxID=1076 RepID=A0A933S5V9_RHOPL|nr:hypothetical protein [Rhodopseudomonas palustris]
MHNYQCLARRTIAAAGFVAALAVMQVSATEGAVASNEAVTTPVTLGPIAQGVATSTTEAARAASADGDNAAKADAAAAPPAPVPPTTQGVTAASTAGAMAKAPAPAAKRTPVATAQRSWRRTESGETLSASWHQRHFVLMLGISY